jgi:hypothetical protein
MPTFTEITKQGMYLKRKIEARKRNDGYRGRACYILQVCRYHLLPSIKGACTVSCAACPAQPYLSILSHKRHYIRKTKVT